MPPSVPPPPANSHTPDSCCINASNFVSSGMRRSVSFINPYAAFPSISVEIYAHVSSSRRTTPTLLPLLIVVISRIEPCGSSVTAASRSTVIVKPTLSTSPTSMLAKGSSADFSTKPTRFSPAWVLYSINSHISPLPEMSAIIPQTSNGSFRLTSAFPFAPR